MAVKWREYCERLLEKFGLNFEEQFRKFSVRKFKLRLKATVKSYLIVLTEVPSKVGTMENTQRLGMLKNQEESSRKEGLISAMSSWDSILPEPFEECIGYHL